MSNISVLAQQLYPIIRDRNRQQTQAFDSVVRSFQLILSQKNSLLNRNETLTKEYAAATSRVSSISVSETKMASGGEEHIRGLKEKVHALQEQLTSKWQEVSELTKAQLMMTQAVANANKIQQDAQSKAQEWHAALKQSESSVQSLKKLLLAKEKECETLRSELQKVRDMLEKSEKHLCGLTAENESLVSRMIDEKMGMMTELNKMTSTCDTLKIQLAKLKEENERLKTEGCDAKVASPKPRKASSGIWASLTGKSRGVSASSNSEEDRVATTSGWNIARAVKLPAENTVCIQAHQAEVNDLTFVGNSVATASGDGTIKVWDARTASLRSNFHAGGAALCIDATKNMIVTGTTDSQAVIYDINTERQKHVLSGHKGKVVGVKFAPDGKAAASVGTDRCIKIFDVSTGRCIRSLACPSACTSTAFTLDGGVVVSGHQDSGVRLWDVRAGAMTQEIKGIHRAAVTSVQVAPSGSGSCRILTLSRDNTMKMIDGRTYSETVCFKENSFRVGWNYSAACFSPNGAFVAAPSGDGRVIIWNSLSGTVAKIFKAHTRSCMAVNWSRRNVIGSVDNAGYMALYV